MTEYFITFYTKVSAKNEKDLRRKAETIAESMSKCIRKKVYEHGYLEIEKTDVPKTQATLD